MSNDIQKMTDHSFDNIVNTIKKLISIKGFSGSEEGRVDYLIELGQTLGYDKIGKDQRGNLIGEIVLGTGQGPRIILTGHLDTVWADEKKWNHETPPFQGVVKEGKIYGRGSADMLGADSSMFYALSDLKKIISSDYNGKLYFVGTTCEEFFEGVNLLEVMKEIHPDYLIIGEASECRINIGQRGRAEVLITTHGKSVHASNGLTVVNAIDESAEVVDIFKKYKPAKDPLLGQRIIVPTDINIPIGGGGGLDGRGGNSTVPNKVDITYDLRLLAGDSEESIKQLLHKEIKKIKRKRADYYQEPEFTYASDAVITYTGVEIKQNKFAPAWKTDKKTDIVQKAQKGLLEAGLDHTALGAYSFCTDGSAIIKYRETYPDNHCEIIGFGPGKESYAHIVNEFIELESVKKAYQGYFAICRELLGDGSSSK